MTKSRTDYSRVSKMKKSTSGVLMKIREGEAPVRIRSGAGINFSHVDGMYLGPGVFDVDEILDGPGSKKGWGHLANALGWVALDFVEEVN